MEKTQSGFGLLSGISTALGLTPAIFRLVMFLITGTFCKSIQTLFFLPLLTRLFGEWYFWKVYGKKIYGNVVEDKATWQKIVTHPNAFPAFLMLFTDIFADLTLIKFAIDGQVPAAYIGFALFATQALAAPIQGYISDLFSRKKGMLFAAFISMGALIVTLGIPVEGENMARVLSEVIGISGLTPTVAIVLVLCCKGLFGNASVIARAAIADIVRYLNSGAAEQPQR